MIARRDVLKSGAAAAMAAPPARVDATPLRIGFVGVGARGTALLELLLKFGGVQVPAIADVSDNNLRRAQAVLEKAGQPRPETYAKGDTDFRRLCDRNDLDIVLTATPWQWHTPIAVAAMKAGKHAAVEVPAAVTLEECWQLVETAEKTGKQCAMLENEVYARNSLFVLNLIRSGIFGEPMFAEAGYMHDLRAAQLNTPWLLEQTRKRNGNLYPTHPLGPIAWWMDITRGDSLTFLVSMSTKSAAMHEFAGRKSANTNAAFALGDVNTTILRTEQGRSISLYYDVSTPRPKEQLIRLQASKGAYSFQNDKIFFDGRSNMNTGPNWLHNPLWEPTDSYRQQYEHALWLTHGDKAKTTAHGGTDYMTAYRFLKAFREGKAPDIDVYDAATWSAIAPLTEKSVADRSRPVDVPDFTRGKWRQRVPVDPDAIV